MIRTRLPRGVAPVVAGLLAAGLFVAGCGSDDGGQPPGGSPGGAAGASTPPVAEPDGGQEDDSDEVPDEQALCGAVDEAPIRDAFGEEITNRAFHPPSGAGVNISCNWETLTKSVTVKYVIWPSFRELVDDDILNEYGEGEFDGFGVEAYRNVYRGVIIAGPHGWAIDIAILGTFVPTDEQRLAIGQAALDAVNRVS